MDQISRLRDWFSEQCDGDWEHTYGIRLETLDNPGWLLEVDLADTELQGRDFTAIRRGDSESGSSWLHCSVASGKFQASGGVPDLPDMLEAFLQWAGV